MPCRPRPKSHEWGWCKPSQFSAASEYARSCLPRSVPTTIWLPSDAELIERLRGWAEEFDELDPDRYTAQEFVEFVRLEHLPPRPRPKAAVAAQPDERVYTLVGAGAAALAMR